jgi:hypothetical protein
MFTHRRTEIRLQDGGKRLTFITFRQNCLPDHITHKPEGESAIEMKQEVGGVDGEMEPSPSQSNAPVANPMPKILTEQLLYVGKNGWITRGMESMAAKINPDTIVEKTPGVAANDQLVLNKCDPRSLTSA